MGKRTVEKASCEKGLFGNAQSDSEKGLFGNAQSLRQSSARCGTRFVGVAEGTGSVEALSEKGRGSQSCTTSDSSLNEDGTRFVGAA